MTAVSGSWLSTAPCVQEPCTSVEQRQRFTALRLELGASVGLGRGVWLGFGAPVELRSVGTTWWRGLSPVDGVPAMPVDGTEVGLGDVVVRGGFLDQPLGSTVLLGPTFGLAIPTGRIGPDPETLPPTEQRRRQFGGGTFDPIVGFDLFYVRGEAGVWWTAAGRFPLARNRHGYQGGVSGSMGLGPTFRPHDLPWLQLHLLAELRVQGPERWGDRFVPEAARVAPGLAGGVVVNPTQAFSIQVRGTVTPWEAIGADRFRLPLTLTLGATGLLDPPKRRRAPS